jgi:hypothetical protein
VLGSGAWLPFGSEQPHRRNSAGPTQMSAATDNRIVALRTKVQQERAILSDLNNLVSRDLKTLAKSASFLLDDVDGFFLAPSVLRHPPRTDNEMMKWLDNAETVLDRAIKHRKWVESLVKKFGPNARFTGGR